MVTCMKVTRKPLPESNPHAGVRPSPWELRNPCFMACLLSIYRFSPQPVSISRDLTRWKTFRFPYHAWSKCSCSDDRFLPNGRFEDDHQITLGHLSAGHLFAGAFVIMDGRWPKERWATAISKCKYHPQGELHLARLRLGASGLRQDDVKISIAFGI
jgi:hypothetical protein